MQMFHDLTLPSERLLILTNTKVWHITAELIGISVAKNFCQLAIATRMVKLSALVCYIHQSHDVYVNYTFLAAL